MLRKDSKITYVMACSKLYNVALYLVHITTIYELKNLISSRDVQYTIWYSASVSGRHILNYICSKTFYDTSLGIMFLHKI
jgi:hypothetical protein